MFVEFTGQIATEDLEDEVLETIDLVRRRKTCKSKIMINAPTVLIKPEITSVSLSDILDDPPPNQYIETDQFRELILICKEKLPERFIDKDTEH